MTTEDCLHALTQYSSMD